MPYRSWCVRRLPQTQERDHDPDPHTSPGDQFVRWASCLPTANARASCVSRNQVHSIRERKPRNPAPPGCRCPRLSTNGRTSAPPHGAIPCAVRARRYADNHGPTVRSGPSPVHRRVPAFSGDYCDSHRTSHQCDSPVREFSHTDRVRTRGPRTVHRVVAACKHRHWVPRRSDS